MKIDTEDDGVYVETIGVAAFRKWMDGDTEDPLPGDLMTACDNAQAYAFEGNGKAYVVIEITPEK